MSAYFLLAFSIISEVAGSTLLKLTDGFKRILPTLGMIIGYGLAFYGLSLTLRTLPLGVAYAIWAGIGTALTAIAGIVIYKETFNRRIFFGLCLVIAGVILMNIG